MRLSMYLFSVLSLSLFLTSGCGDKPTAEHAGGNGMPPPPTVGIAHPIIRTEPMYRDLTGSIEALQTVQLNPQVSGLVTKVFVADGAHINAGEVSLEIDQAPYLATIARVKAEIQRAESRTHVAALQLDRAKQLVAEKVISRQQYDNNEAELQIAQADLAAAKAAMLTAQLDLGYTKVTAPISGRLGKILTTVGNLVQGGGPVPPTYITTIVSMDPVYVTFDLDEVTWNDIGTRLFAATNGGDPIPVLVGLIGEHDYSYSGKVTSIDNHINQGSGSMRIRASLPNPKQKFTPGAFARVRLEVAPAKKVTLIHERAIKSQFNTRYVYVLDKDNATVMRPIQLGAIVGDKRIVLGGLEEADRVVLVGHAKIFMPGMHVVPKTASMETGTMAEDSPPAEHVIDTTTAPTKAAVPEAADSAKNTSSEESK
jgi:multidrug efflux system membrane fusion protein